MDLRLQLVLVACSLSIAACLAGSSNDERAAPAKTGLILVQEAGPFEASSIDANAADSEGGEANVVAQNTSSDAGVGNTALDSGTLADATIVCDSSPPPSTVPVDRALTFDSINTFPSIFHVGNFLFVGRYRGALHGTENLTSWNGTKAFFPGTVMLDATSGDFLDGFSADGMVYNALSANGAIYLVGEFTTVYSHGAPYPRAGLAVLDSSGNLLPQTFAREPWYDAIAQDIAIVGNHLYVQVVPSSNPYGMLIAIVRYDLTTGQFLGTVVSETNATDTFMVDSILSSPWYVVYTIAYDFHTDPILPITAVAYDLEKNIEVAQFTLNDTSLGWRLAATRIYAPNASSITGAPYSHPSTPDFSITGITPSAGFDTDDAVYFLTDSQLVAYSHDGLQQLFAIDAVSNASAQIVGDEILLVDSLVAKACYVETRLRIVDRTTGSALPFDLNVPAPQWLCGGTLIPDIDGVWLTTATALYHFSL